MNVSLARAWVVLAFAVACSGTPAPDSGSPIQSDPEGDPAPGPEPLPQGEGDLRCAHPVPVYREGARDGDVCDEAAARNGLTVIDLGDDWAPFLFSESPDHGEVGHQPYRQVYLALADERLEDVPAGLDRERFVELFGIFPTFRVLLERLGDEARHRCHAAVDDSGLESLGRTLRPHTPREEQRERLRTVGYLRHRLSRAMTELGLSELADLEGHERWGAHYERMVRLGTVVDAIVATQAHLSCDGFIGDRVRVEAGVFDWRTARVLGAYQRQHAIVARPLLDEATREALAGSSRLQDWETALRALRERVVDAAGLIEDGSAGRTWSPVLGRSLDAPELRFEAGHPAADEPAPDLIAPATEAAARALGWTDPGSTLAELRSLRNAGHDRVAVPLPPPPAYHSPTMELRAEIDRGDVYYRFPYDSRGRRRPERIERRPILTLYARDGQREVALVRWPTTIGGWKPERRPGGSTGLKYKRSYVGDVVWRDVIASPAWLPPTTTPDDELLRRVRGRLVPNYGLFGPGYRSAFGLVMLVHHRVLDPRDPDADPESPEAQPRFFDQGIRTHGSVGYRSITRGQSHGCHRLYNHFAERLASFLLRHRAFERHGSIDVRYRRRVRGLDFRIRSRGYRFELTPPVPVRVLEGRIRGGVNDVPTGFRPLPETLASQVEAESGDE